MTERGTPVLPELCINFDSTTNLTFKNEHQYLLGKKAYYWSKDLAGKPLKLVGDDGLPMVVKFLIAVNGYGAALPTVMMLEDPTMADDEFCIQQVPQFSPYANNEMPGYFAICRSRVGNVEFFRWYLKMLHAYINEHLRPQVDLHDGLVDTAMIMMDSESSQLKAAIDLADFFTASKIHLVKSNPSATGIEQILDLSFVFPLLHSGAEHLATHHYVFNQRYHDLHIVPALLALYDVASLSHIKHGTLLAVSLTKCRALLQFALGRPSAVLTAFRKTGIEFDTEELVNTDTMITNFPGARLADADMLKRVRDSIAPARDIMAENGFITQDELVNELEGPVVAHIQDELDQGAKPREERPLVNQRACILNSEGMLQHLHEQEEAKREAREAKEQAAALREQRRGEREAKKEEKEEAAAARVDAISAALDVKVSPLAAGMDCRCLDCNVWWGAWQVEGSGLEQGLKGNAWHGCKFCEQWFCRSCKTKKQVEEHEEECAVEQPAAKSKRRV